MRSHWWKILIMGKGAYNIFFVILAWFFRECLLKMLGLEDVGHNNLVFFDLFLAHALLFGVGFVLVGFETRQNHVVILIGALAMFSLFLITTWYCLAGSISQLAMVPAVIDLICALLFAIFWWRYEWEPDRTLKE